MLHYDSTEERNIHTYIHIHIPLVVVYIMNNRGPNTKPQGEAASQLITERIIAI